MNLLKLFFLAVTIMSMTLALEKLKEQSPKTSAFSVTPEKNLLTQKKK